MATGVTTAKIDNRAKAKSKKAGARAAKFLTEKRIALACRHCPGVCVVTCVLCIVIRNRFVRWHDASSVTATK